MMKAYVESIVKRAGINCRTGEHMRQNGAGWRRRRNGIRRPVIRHIEGKDNGERIAGQVFHLGSVKYNSACGGAEADCPGLEIAA